MRTSEDYEAEIMALKSERDCLKHELHKSMDALKNKNKHEELKEAALPMLEFLNKYYHPHAYAIVTEGRVEIVEGAMACPLLIRD